MFWKFKKKFFCNEKTELNPISPYGKAKTFSLWIGIYYRKNYNFEYFKWNYF